MVKQIMFKIMFKPNQSYVPALCKKQETCKSEINKVPN